MLQIITEDTQVDQSYWDGIAQAALITAATTKPHDNEPYKNLFLSSLSSARLDICNDRIRILKALAYLITKNQEILEYSLDWIALLWKRNDPEDNPKDFSTIVIELGKAQDQLRQPLLDFTFDLFVEPLSNEHQKCALSALHELVSEDTPTLTEEQASVLLENLTPENIEKVTEIFYTVKLQQPDIAAQCKLVAQKYLESSNAESILMGLRLIKPTLAPNEAKTIERITRLNSHPDPLIKYNVETLLKPPVLDTQLDQLARLQPAGAEALALNRNLEADPNSWLKGQNAEGKDRPDKTIH
jgi:hypothetical protein